MSTQPKNKIYKSLTEKLNIKIISNEEELSEIKNNYPTEEDTCYKILVIGTKLVGKTSFCERISRNIFDLELKPSNETSCYLRTLTLFDEDIKLFLLDIKENSLDIDEEKEIYKDIDGIIALYDITQFDSYIQTEKILNSTKKKCNWDNKKPIPIYMLGNKNDLKFLRALDYAENNEKARMKGYEIKEINCCKDDDNVYNIIKNLVARIYFNNLKEDDKKKLRDEAKKYMK